ncbi:MAG: DUF4214 domain-containing protein, partial [Ramlibacter sp.]
MSITTTQLVELYLAYFGRPPDAGGIRYYTTGNFTLNDVVRSFSASPESKALHGEGFGAAQINAIYQNLFNRDAEPAGQAYWLAAVNSGSITPAQAALSILQGAQNSDKTAVQNKLALASAFLVELDTEREITGYAGDGPAALARTFLKTVDASATSLAAALAALQTQVSLVTGQTSAPGPTPSPAPPPAFAVAKDGGNIVSFTAAGTQIAVTEAGGTFTFTSSGGSTGTGTATGTVSGAVVPTGTTLSISSTLASGKTFSGTGTALVVAGAAGEDLTAFTATGVGGFQLTTGQNYTMTAAQAAIGRIGAAGAAGTLTDPGTVTVRDTLAALGGGVAATLKTNGADSVIATAATGADVSAITVAGIDGITLATGQNYTMTAAQAALVNTAPGSQTVTLSNQATGTLNVLVESFVLGNFANSVTLGTAAQNVSSAAGNPTTLAIGGTTATGTWALANGADVLVATAGANITAVNAGAATTAESLTLTGGITMTQAQHEALVAITAGGGGDSVVITTSGVVSARNSVETYAVAQGANPNTVAVSAGTAGVNIIGGAGGTATVVIDAGVTATGTYTLAGADDRLSVSGTTSITGINGGAATTAEQLTLVTTGTTAMTQAQHAGFTTINAAGVADVISITTGGAVAAAAAVEAYSVSAGGANNVTVNAGKTNVAITGASGNVTTVTVSGIAVNGAWNLGNGADLIIATGGANIAGVNSGAATTAENLALTGSIIMTQAQHEAPLAITAGGGSDSVTITTGGAVTARADVESYTVSNGGSNTLFLNARSITINGGSSGTTVSIGGNTVGGTWALGHATLDGITATDGANIAAVNAGAVTTAEKLDLTGAITMTAAQYNALNTGGITAAGGSDRIILTTALTGGETLNSVVENFTLAAANYTVTLGAAQTIDAQALIAGQTLTLAGSSNAVVSLGAGNVVMTGSGNTTVTGGTGNNTITLGSGADTVNAGDGADIITGGTGIDTLNGQNGNDTFLYGSMALFLSANSLLDLVDGGNNLDTVEIAGAITLTTASDLTRMSNVEQITARSQSSTALAHSIVVNSDFLLNGVTTIDLSADTNATSSATLDFTGVTTALTLKGVGGNGNNNITGGSGVDTLVGG